MSRWERWSSGEEKLGFSSFLKENNPSAAMGPAERARALGLQSDGKGGYIDPTTGQLAARTVNGELIFYDTNSPDGGAVSDGEGGQKLVQQQPSWADPLTGMLTTPPANPESPQEIAAIPDPTPATPPAGFNSFMQQKKKAAYQQNKEAPQPARMTPDEAEEQEAQAQQGDPAQQQAFAAEDRKTLSQMFEADNPKDTAKRMAAGYEKMLQSQAKDATKSGEARAKAVESGGYDIKSLVARSQGLQPGNGDLQSRARAQAGATPQPSQTDNVQTAAQPTVNDPSDNARQELMSRLEGIINAPEKSRGAGSNKLSLDDVKKFKYYIENGPQNQRTETSEEDLDWSIEFLKGKLGKKWGSLQNRMKGKGDPEPSRKIVARAREVLKSYLNNMGQSAIDGSPLNFSDSELDHGISLSNGGVDDDNNWRWLPKRYNQFKGDLEDESLLEKLQKQMEVDPQDEELKDRASKLTNKIRGDWGERFKSKGWDDINQSDIRGAKGNDGMQMLKALAQASGTSYYKDRGVTRDSGRAGGGVSLGADELKDRLIQNLNIPSRTDVLNTDASLWELMDELEGQRSDLYSDKKSRSKEKRNKKKI